MLPAGEKFDAEEISRKTRRPAVVPAQPGSGGDSDKSSRRVLRLSRSYRDVDLRSTLNSGHRRQEGHREPRESKVSLELFYLNSFPFLHAEV